MRYTGRERTEETALSRKSAPETKRAFRAVSASLTLGLAMALAACESSPVMGPAPMPPPPGIDPAAPPPPAPPPLPPSVGRWDGLWGGEATLTLAPGGNLRCPARIAITDFVVQDGRARFQQYRGRVDVQGRVRLTWRQAWITGQFSDRGFEGRVFQPHPACRYEITLNRIGAP